MDIAPPYFAKLLASRGETRHHDIDALFVGLRVRLCVLFEDRKQCLDFIQMIREILGHPFVTQRIIPMREPITESVHALESSCKIIRDNATFCKQRRNFPLAFGACADLGKRELPKIEKRLDGGEESEAHGRKPCASMAIIDAQSVKNTETAHLKGYDGGKKISGIKRHLAVDTNGLPHAIHVTAASATDRAGAIEMVEKSKQNLASVEKVLVDGGYSGDPFRDTIKEILGAEVEVAKRSELHTFKVIPKRWVVERSLSWLEKCRRLWKNCERLVTSSVAMAQLAFIRILLNRI